MQKFYLCFLCLLIKVKNINNKDILKILININIVKGAIILNMLYNFLFFLHDLNKSKYIIKYKIKFHSSRRRTGRNKKGKGEEGCTHI